MKSLAVRAGLAAAFASLGLSAHAEDWVEDMLSNSRFVVGAALRNHPEYSGSDRRKTSLAPVLAYEYRWLRLSASGASAILGFGQDARGPGATAALIDRPDLKLGFGLRIDSGRKASDSVELTGFDDIKRTLRGRVYASYALNSRWTVAGNVSQDLLGNRGGAIASTDLGYRMPLGPRTEMTVGAGASWADVRHMSTYFGVTDAESARSGLPVYRPGAGLLDVHAGIGLTTAFTPRWIGFASVGASRIESDAATSPLTRKPGSVSGSIGLAYRCCSM